MAAAPAQEQTRERRVYARPAQPRQSPSHPRWQAAPNRLPQMSTQRISQCLWRIHHTASHHTVPANHQNRPPAKCLVHLKIARNAPRLLGFAI